MSKFFDVYPKIPYDIAGKQISNYQQAANIFFRLRTVQSVLSNITAYYEFVVSDSDTPEILAEKVYGDAEAHWIILMANNIVDAQFDWPLNDRAFAKYIVDKYGSVAAAKTSFHHYEKVITREESAVGVLAETRFVVNQTKLTDNSLNVPYDYYEGSGSLPETQSVETYNLPHDRTVVETIRRESISNYDYENSLNEAKRNIKIIKPEYYGQILNEFNSLTSYASAPYLRKLV